MHPANVHLGFNTEVDILPRKKGDPHKLNLAGQRFGRWQVVEQIGGSLWGCICDCGTKRGVLAQSLRAGTSVSCGCLAVDRSTKHGMEGTSIYNIWAGMKQRCQNPNYHGYATYGGRGIKVCERWQSFENFYADVGDKPEGKSLDRFPDQNGNYEPGNWRWATSKEQARNKRTNILVDGIPLAEIAELHGLKRKVVEYRYRAGYRGADLIAKILPRGKLALIRNQ